MTHHGGQPHTNVGDQSAPGFYERNRIVRPMPNVASPSELLDSRSRDRLLRNAFAEMRHMRRWRGQTLWTWVSRITGHGSGYSLQICVELGWDPEMCIGPKVELPRVVDRRAGDGERP